MTDEQDLRAGEELFRVPLALAISGKESDNTDSLTPNNACVHPHTFLAAKSLREMASDASPWQPYFQACPLALYPALTASHDMRVPTSSKPRDGMQIWPQEVPSLFGTFPGEFLPELEGALPPSSWRQMQCVHEDYSRFSREEWGGTTEADLQDAFPVHSHTAQQ